MMIKTLDNVYINMEDFSGFTIGYPNDSDFTVMAMKELVDNQTATIELGRYPSEKEAKDALKSFVDSLSCYQSTIVIILKKILGYQIDMSNFLRRIQSNIMTDYAALKDSSICPDTDLCKDILTSTRS